MERNMSGIGKRIKERRENLDMTQEELAKKLGYKSKTTIAKIENGTNDIVQSKVVEFAKALTTTPAYLMGWKDSPQDDHLVDFFSKHPEYVTLVETITNLHEDDIPLAKELLDRLKR